MDVIITSQELNSLRFYQGDLLHYITTTEAESIKYNSPFYKTKGAYHILNLLLYPGMDNEITRICHENKKIPIHLLENMSELIAIYGDIFTVMCKYQRMNRRKGSIHAFRKDRMQSMAMVDNHAIFAFTSCSLKDKVEDYFLKKDGLLLLEYEIADSIPYVVMNDVLIDNPYQYQEEILLPPFTAFTVSELKFTEKELNYKDVNKEPPKGKYLLSPTHMLIQDASNDSAREVQNMDLLNICDKEQIDRAVRVLKGLAEGVVIEESEVSSYCDWKKEVQKTVRTIMRKSYFLFNEDV